MKVEIVRSARRRTTAELRPTAEGVRISIPASATQDEEDKYVRTLLRRYEKHKDAEAIDLEQRAAQLSETYGLGYPETIRWVDNQNTRWGSCTPSNSSIRISSSVAKFPLWVIDYVIVHELAHLTYFGHGPRFWSLVNRYPSTERARGFLIAKGLEDIEPNDDISGTETPSENTDDSPPIDLREVPEVEPEPEPIAEPDDELEIESEPGQLFNFDTLRRTLRGDTDDTRW